MGESSNSIEEPRQVSVRHAFSVIVFDTTLIPPLREMGISAEICYVPDPGAKALTEDSAFVAVKPQNGSEVVIAERWKQRDNRAEEYLPNDAIKLINAVKTSKGRFHKGYLVLGGPGWSRSDIVVCQALGKYIVDYNLIEVISLDKFLKLASKKWSSNVKSQ